MSWFIALIRQWRRTRTLRRAIARLPEQDRSIVLFTARDGLSHAEVADRLGISTGTVEIGLARALNSVARDLDRHDDE